VKYLFHLGHPAHFHLFKNVIFNLEQKGHSCAILIKRKDILEELLQISGMNYYNLLPAGRKDSRFGTAWGMIKTDFKLLKFVLKFKPDIMIGTSYAISHVGKFMKITSVNVNEDDADAVPMYSKLSYPWANVIVTPVVCNNGKWEKKSIKYQGYHELAYLHPHNFKPDKEIVRKYFNPDESYFIIRFAKLTAHHDKGINGISSEIALKIINLLKPHGNIYITSEKLLDPGLEQYRMLINPLEMHHIIAFARLYIGDSQTMAAEAGVLGIPFIRFNDFVGRIGYLNELENIYHLGFGIKTNEEQKLYSTIIELLNIPSLKEKWHKKRETMLNEKIDTCLFLTWFIENYPESVSIMRDNPDYQYKFR